MSKLEHIENTARLVARGSLTIDQAKALLPACRFELLPNGRCFWFAYGSGLKGSEA